MKIVRSILAVIFGFLVVFVSIMVGELVSFIYFGPSDEKPLMERMKEMEERLQDKDAMKAYLDAQPTGALVAVLVTLAAGSFLGGATSALIAARWRTLHACLIGVAVLAAHVRNVIQMKEQWGWSHPDWMLLASLILPVPMSLLAGWLVSLLFPAQSAPQPPVNAP